MTAARSQRVRRPLHGVLLLDKPPALSSNQALQKVRWLLHAEKGGHTGTLDPLATGVLPLCFGAATKFSQLHLDADKTYETIVRLGQSTTTGDALGECIDQQAVRCTPAMVAQVLQRFRGPLAQVPPMYSALKKNGQALYHYARQGITVERAERAVTIYDLQLLALALQGEAPFLHLRVHCSKGTYIRTLGADIAQALGCGGHVHMLRRTQTGPFDVAQCVALAQIEALSAEQRQRLLRPIDCLLPAHQVVQLQADDAARFLVGMRRRGYGADAKHVRVYGPATAPQGALAHGVLLGTARICAGELIATRLLSPLEVQQQLSLPLP